MLMVASGCKAAESVGTSLCRFECLNVFLWQNAQTMILFQESTVNCPYCGEPISILVDESVEEQQYIEDCEVCCRPMDVKVIVEANGSVQLDVRSEND